MTRTMLVRPASPESKRPRGRPPKAPKAVTPDTDDVAVLLAGLDTLGLTSQARVSAAVYDKLAEAKQAARLAEAEGSAHCPAWLGAQVRPTGARGGYPYLIDADDFAVKVAGQHQAS